MKFLVFGGERYYPGGGFHDFLGSDAMLDDAVARVRHFFHDGDATDSAWAHIVRSDDWEPSGMVKVASLRPEDLSAKPKPVEKPEPPVTVTAPVVKSAPVYMGSGRFRK